MSVQNNKMTLSRADSGISSIFNGTDAISCNGEFGTTPGLSREDSYLSDYESPVPVIKPYSARYRRQSERLSVHLSQPSSRPVSSRSGSRGKGRKIQTASSNLSNEIPSFTNPKKQIVKSHEMESVSDFAHEEETKHHEEEDARMKQYKIDVVNKILAEFDLEKTLLKYRTMEKETLKLNPMDFDHDR